MSRGQSPPRLAPVRPDLVWVRGPDTIRFLNDLLSQEIADSDSGAVLRSFLLDPQGKLDHILWVLRGQDEVGLVTDEGRGPELIAALARFKIRVDLDIVAEAAPARVVVGEDLGMWRRWQSTDSVVLADISWEDAARSLRTGERPDYGEMSREEYDALRIEAGEPALGADVAPGAIPHQSGLVPVAVDFAKGCFLGQELVARIDSRGAAAPQRLMILDFDGSAPQRGASVLAEDRKVGEITSAAGSKALGMLRREVSPGDMVSVDGNPAVARETAPV